MFDMKVMRSALEQLEEERGIPRDKTLKAIEDALAAAYKKDYGKRGQIIRAHFNLDSGDLTFEQVKIVVDDSMLRADDEENPEVEEMVTLPNGEEVRKVKWNEEHHIQIEDAKRIKKDVELGEELIFPLENKDDYGRIAAQTAKQVIMQKIREAEKVSVLDEFGKRVGEIVSGHVQRVERGNVFVDLGRATGILYRHEQIPGEHYRQGERIRAYLMEVEETPRGINLKLSRSAPEFVAKLFEHEAPEIAGGTVEIKAIAREAGSRTKIALFSHDESIDAVGSAVGQRGVRVSTVISELGGEKIDIMEWSELPENFIANALSPGKVQSIELDEETEEATVHVSDDQLSLVIGRGGQNVRLAARLTGWKLDIVSPNSKTKEEREEERAKRAEEAEDSEDEVETPNENEEQGEETMVESTEDSEESKEEVESETEEKES